jgi:uncharacterized protein YunC (DUF1805 family)
MPAMKSIDIEISGKKVTAVEIPLPGAPLVLASGLHGFVMCGYLNVAVAEKLGVAAAMVRGVKTADDLLVAKIVECTKAASERGVTVGMTGQDALSRLI